MPPPTPPASGAAGAACCIDMAMSWTLSLLDGERNRATSPTRQAMGARDAALRLGASADPEAIEDGLDAVDGDLYRLLRGHVFLRDVGFRLWPKLL